MCEVDQSEYAVDHRISDMIRLQRLPERQCIEYVLNKHVQSHNLFSPLSEKGGITSPVLGAYVVDYYLGSYYGKEYSLAVLDLHYPDRLFCVVWEALISVFPVTPGSSSLLRELL